MRARQIFFHVPHLQVERRSLHIYIPSLRLRSIHVPPPLSVPIRGYGGNTPNSLTKTWEQLTIREREAWKILGWTERSWAGDEPCPPSDTALWNELSPTEQSALKYGLSYTQKTWDAEMLDEGIEDTDTPNEVTNNSTPSPGYSGAVSSSMSPSGSTKSQGIVKSIFGAFNAAGDIVESAYDTSQSGDVMQFFRETTKDKVALQSGYESIFYLDDSGSMGEMFSSSRLSAAKQALTKTVNIMRNGDPEFDHRSRILMFGDGKWESNAREDRIDLDSIKSSWHGESGGTYLWHMVYRDICRNYTPGPGTLRVVVITDGYDTHSPGEFSGMLGMDPMMKGLLKRSYRIEWNIILLNGQSSRGISSVEKRYADLCGATGGSFLSLDDSFRANARNVKQFMGTLERAVKNGEAVAAEQRRAFEKKVGGTKFDWYAQLPPPKQK